MIRRPLTRLMTVLMLTAVPVGVVAAADQPAVSTLTPGFAAGDATPSPLIMKDLLLGVARAGSRIVAVGEFGHIALSDDQGATWRQAKTVPTEATLTSVTFIDAQNGWAAGHDKTILITADGGETWTMQYSRPASLAAGIKLAPRERAPEPGVAPEGAVDTGAIDGAVTDEVANGAPADADAAFIDGDTTGSELEPDIPFLGLAFTSPTHGIAVGGFNYAAETNDGGKTWTPRRLVKTAGDDFHLNAIVTGPDGLMIVPSELGQVYRSLDNGATWEIVQTDYEGSFWNALALKDGSMLVMGMRGNVWRSTDRGQSWTQNAVDLTPESVSSGIQLDDGTIVLVGIGGLVMASKDNGATWDLSLSQADRKGIANVAAGPDGTLLLFGEAGLQTRSLTAPQG